MTSQVSALSGQITTLTRQLQTIDATLGARVDAVNARLDVALASIAGLGAQATATLDALNSQITTTNNSLTSLAGRIADLNDDMERSFELIAISAALGDAVPNPGDRFALRVNAAGFNGEFAGAVGASVTVAERARLSLNYGRGGSQGILNGGVNLSFR